MACRVHQHVPPRRADGTGCRRQLDQPRKHRTAMEITAAVLREAGTPMSIETLDLDDPRPGEIVVEIAGCGVCHTDLSFRDGAWPYPLPAVLGHEGAGTIVETGSAVTTLAVGDRVVLSFGFCGTCPSCLSGVPANCPNAPLINMRGTRDDGSVTLLSPDGNVVHGSFNSQSSFATHVVTEEPVRDKTLRRCPP